MPTAAVIASAAVMTPTRSHGSGGRGQRAPTTRSSGRRIRTQPPDPSSKSSATSRGAVRSRSWTSRSHRRQRRSSSPPAMASRFFRARRAKLDVARRRAARDQIVDDREPTLGGERGRSVEQTRATLDQLGVESIGHRSLRRRRRRGRCHHSYHARAARAASRAAGATRRLLRGFGWSRRAGVRVLHTGGDATGARAWRWACRLIEPSDSPLIPGPGQKWWNATRRRRGGHAGSSSRRIPR